MVVEPPAREPASAIIKGSAGAAMPFPSLAPPPRRSALFKRDAVVTVEEAPSAEVPPATPPAESPAEPDVVRIPTGDRPPPPPLGATMVQTPGVLAADTVAAPAGPPVDQQVLEDAKRRAEATVRQSQMEARKIVEEGNVYAQQLKAQAQAQGYEEGKQKGYEDARREVAEVVFQSRVMLAQTLQARELVLRSAQGEIAGLAMKIAERVTSTAVSADPDVVRNQVLAALERVKDREHISVHVNPQDLEVARAHREIFEKVLETPKSFDIVGDLKVDRGGAVIETNLGNVDARINTQLTALSVAFDEIRRREHQEAEMAAAEVARQNMPAPPAPPVEEVPPAPEPAPELPPPEAPPPPEGG